MIRHSRIVILCEDIQQESFVRRWMKRIGWDHRMVRVNRAPGPRGSAEQYVRTHFPHEITKLRSGPKVGLVAVIDADTKTVEQRMLELNAACGANGNALKEDAPDSLKIGCDEIRTRVLPLKER